MTRAALLTLALLLGGCVEWIPVIGAGLGVIVGAEQIVTAKEQQPPAPDVPQFDGSWIPP